MAEPILTADNHHLSGVTKALSDTRMTGIQERSAINCTNDLFLNRDSAQPETQGKQIADLLRHAHAPNTAAAHASDLWHFRDWGGSLPTTPEVICAYIADHAGVLAVATIQRRLATLAKAHRAAGLANPCGAEIVTTLLRGVKRKYGTAQDRARPLMREELFLILDQMGDSLRDHRDRALLLLGFAGGFRRSELTGLDCADVAPVRQGLIVTLRRSKTDQDGAGRDIGIPFGRTRHCPVMAIAAWRQAAGIDCGPLFRPVNRHGHLGPSALTGDAVSIILRDRLAAAGIDPTGYSGHSLRAGFATSAAQAGIPTLRIRQQTGHASDTMLARYIRTADLFTENAAGTLL